MRMFSKECIFYGTLGLGVYGCTFERSAPQANDPVPPTSRRLSRFWEQVRLESNAWRHTRPFEGHTPLPPPLPRHASHIGSLDTNATPQQSWNALVRSCFVAQIHRLAPEPPWPCGICCIPHMVSGFVVQGN